MTNRELAQMIESIGLPFAYYEFPDTEQIPPFICYFFPDDDDFSADNINYQPIRRCRLEFYAPVKDFATERTIEDTLNAAGLFFRRVEGYIESERMYMVTYDFSVVITGY